MIGSIELVEAWLSERAAVVYIDGAIVWAWYQILIIMDNRTIGRITSASSFLIRLVLEHSLKSILVLFLLHALEIFGCLFLITRNHHEIKTIHLSIVVRRLPFDNRAFVKIPYDDGSIFRPRSKISIAVANLDINDNILMAMQRCLKHQSVLPPNFNDSNNK